MTDVLENPSELVLDEDVYELDKEEIPCNNCGETGLETIEDCNGNNALQCPECGNTLYYVEVDIPEQVIDLNIDGISEATISKKCRKHGEHFEYAGRNQWERFSDRNRWRCGKGCLRKFHQVATGKIKEGKALVSIYDIIPSKRVPVTEENQ